MELGQCATPVRVSASRRTAASSRCTQCASHTSGPNHPIRSRYSAGVHPKVVRQKFSSSTVSARWVCRRTSCLRASAAASVISSSVTENGEQGATPTRTIAPGAGSWWRAIAASVSARIVSRSSTTSSGGSPPRECPRSIDPRVGWNRSPTSPAARTSAAKRSPRPDGNT